jgi:hypothetical protein
VPAADKFWLQEINLSTDELVSVVAVEIFDMRIAMLDEPNPFSLSRNNQNRTGGVISIGVQTIWIVQGYFQTVADYFYFLSKAVENVWKVKNGCHEIGIESQTFDVETVEKSHLLITEANGFKALTDSDACLVEFDLGQLR